MKHIEWFPPMSKAAIRSKTTRGRRKEKRTRKKWWAKTEEDSHITTAKPLSFRVIEHRWERKGQAIYGGSKTSEMAESKSGEWRFEVATIGKKKRTVGTKRCQGQKGRRPGVAQPEGPTDSKPACRNLTLPGGGRRKNDHKIDGPRQTSEEPQDRGTLVSG